MPLQKQVAVLIEFGRKGIHVLACDTDGVDGAAEVAGAYALPDTLMYVAIISLKRDANVGI